MSFEEFELDDFESPAEVKELAHILGLKVSGKMQVVIDKINNHLREIECALN